MKGIETADVVIAGGGPAGAACAWKLRHAGVDVVVIDRAAFPRDKVCAGWITPQVVEDLAIDLDEYRTERTLQPITAFLTGTIGGASEVRTDYDRAVSYGIRRCEFDQFLLERSGARLKLATPISSIRQKDDQWIVADAVKAPLLVGAGGHFCPVARLLNPKVDDNGRTSQTDEALVVAREVEFAIAHGVRAAFATAPECPELYFSADMKGYGWCVRKGGYLNVGFGHLDRRALPQATNGFVAFLEGRGRVPAGHPFPWHGHAYLLNNARRPRIFAEGVLLVGDAAGLAYSQSGEGIRPAIESGLLAAQTILDGHKRDLAPYAERLNARFPVAAEPRQLLPPGLRTPLARWLLKRPAFVRNVVIDRWFLHAADPAFAA